MSNRVLEYISITAIALVVLTSSCSKDDLGEIKNKPEDKKEVEYTWSATADSMQDATYTIFLSSDGTFKQNHTGNNNFNYWWNAHMLDVLVDGYLRTKDEAYVPKMKALLQGIKARNSNRYQNEFNDDMEWLGIACLRAYGATNDIVYKEVAQELWDEVKKGWSEVNGGGIMWRIDTPNEKNACSNGPAAILAARLYDIDKNPEDLEWAKKIYGWLRNTLVDPATGLVWDNIALKNGETVINKDWIFTYNQGTYIGAATELYELTKDKTYLDDAVKTSKSIMTSPKVTSAGLLKSEGQGDGGLFKGILVRYFTLLVQQPDLEENERSSFTNFLKFNAETFFTNGLSRSSMMCSPDWKKKPTSTTDLSTQLSGVMLMEAAARLKEGGEF